MTQKQNYDIKRSYRQFVTENFQLLLITNGFLVKFTKITWPLSYVIELFDGNTICCHVDHIKIRGNSQDDVQSPEHDDTNWDYLNTEFSQSTELSTDSNTSESLPCINQHAFARHHSDLINPPLLDSYS